ncbi:hypothetical protein [Nocardia sp. NBC_01327]|uniref:hypothetical protein n=1 Tax=Nocardia sp. NBC_01327 TaxID=2903593 RepID=UPI002E15F598|nr:hypothetical protein OG326_28375 [Nocardia sp. NBC_01327]
MTQMLAHSTDISGDGCENEPRSLTYRKARALLRVHDQHFACRQYLAAVAYLSADNDVD